MMKNQQRLSDQLMLIMKGQQQVMQQRVRLRIIGNARIKNVGKSQPCMVSELLSTCKQTVVGQQQVMSQQQEEGGKRHEPPQHHHPQVRWARNESAIFKPCMTDI